MKGSQISARHRRRRRRKIEEEDEEARRFYFEKESHFILVFVLVNLSPVSQGCSFVNECVTWNVSLGNNLLQTIAVYVFMSLPSLFMQLVIGFISQRSCAVIPRIAPICTGIHYTMIILTFFYTSQRMVDLKDSLIYLFYAPSLSFAHCPPDVVDEICIDKSFLLQDKTQSFEEIFGKKFELHYLSTYYFYRYVVLGETALDDSIAESFATLRIFTSTLTSIVIVFLSFVLFFMGHIDYRIHGKSIRLVMNTFVIVGVCWFVLNILNTRGPSEGLTSSIITVVQIEILKSFESWTNAVTVVSRTLPLAFVPNVILASHFRPKAPVELFTLHAWLLTITFDLVWALTSMGTVSSLSQDIGINYGDLRYAGDVTMRLITPLQLSTSKTAATLWVFLLNLYLVAAGLIKTCLMVSFIFFTFCDMNPKLIDFKKYILGAISLFTSIYCYINTSPTGALLINDYLNYATIVAEIIVMVIITTCVAWVYGTQQLADDFHFLTGQQPTFFWKITWSLLPPIYMVSLVCLFDAMRKFGHHGFIYISTMIGAIFVPQAIALALKIVKHLKTRSLSHLFKAEDTWGQPDPEERRMRKVYPPRSQVRFRRRRDECKHECLRFNPVLPLIIIREYEMRQKILERQLTQFYEDDQMDITSLLSSDSGEDDT